MQDVCLRFVDSEEESVSCHALTCIGHVARIHGHLGENALAKIKSLLNDPVRGGHAQNAFDDCLHFVGTIRR